MKNFCLALLLAINVFTANAQKKMNLEQTLTQEYLGVERRVLFAQNINLNILQLKVFWPIFELYEKEKEPIVEKRLTILQKYVAEESTMAEMEMDLIQAQSVSLILKISALQDKYYKIIKDKLGIPAAMRFMKIDNQLSATLLAKIYDKTPLNGAITKEEKEKLEENRKKEINMEMK